MHWSDKIANQIVSRQPNKELYTVAAGISPSGSVHIGNFRDVATSYFVALALKRLGKNVRLLFSWDEYDRFRKVPINVSAIAPDFYKYLGRPYACIPDPYGCHESYAQHFEREFEQSLARFGIEVDFRYQAAEYRAGKYANQIVHSVKKRLEIYDIIMDFKTQDATAEERENYYPVSIYCEQCGRDDTHIVSCSEDGTTAQYECKCGHKGSIDFTKDFNCKLAWKIDWPMRWQVEGVDFEPGGKDHAAIGGSYQVSKVISKQIFGYDAPIFQGYEFIGIKGSTGKMSGSTGLNMVPSTLLTVYQPEVILWLYSKTDPTKAFDFCFDDEILRQYFEFDKMLSQYVDGQADEYVNEIMRNTVIEGRKIVPVPMSQLVSFGPIVNWRLDMMQKLFNNIGEHFSQEDFAERATLAQYWLKYCMPENLIALNTEKDVALYNSLDTDTQKMINKLYEGLLNNDFTLEELSPFLYSIPTAVLGEMDDKERRKKQTSFFEVVYKLLIGRTKGPRLYLFLAAVDKEQYLKLLDF